MNEILNHKPRVVILARASSDKQVISGETITTQVDELYDVAHIEGWEVAKLETFVESGRKDDRQIFDNLINYCTNRKNKIDIFLVKNIDRFSRQGSDEYFKVKDKLKMSGVRLVDAEGVIQGEKNTLEKLGFDYDWSKYDPSRSNEIARAEQARDEVRIILTRMISQEIRYVQQGYWNRNSVYGFQNKKIDTENEGRRNILVEYPEEALFVRKMFELKAECGYSDIAIVKDINKLGFKTRYMTRRDRGTKKAIGKIGGNGLTVKLLQRYFRRTVYAGVIVEKWTHDKPIMAKFDGLVTIEQFNIANNGKVYLEQNGSEVVIRYNSSPWSTRRNKHNPMYPYKSVVLCPECHHTLLGSASRGRSGKRFPVYHCTRGHRRFSVKPDILNKQVEDTISQLQFSEEDGRLFKECFLLVYEQRRTNAVVESLNYSRTLDTLKVKQQTVYDTIKTSSSTLIKERAEKEYEELEDQILELGSATSQKEQKELGARYAYKQASHLMEHLEEILIDRKNVANQEMLFRLAFQEIPTYTDLLNGTVKLHPLFKLKSKSLTSKALMVIPAGIEPAIFRMKT